MEIREITYAVYDRIRRSKYTKSSSMLGSFNSNGAVKHNIIFKDKSFIEVFVN